jgi:hypothetical protein
VEFQLHAIVTILMPPRFVGLQKPDTYWLALLRL